MKKFVVTISMLLLIFCNFTLAEDKQISKGEARIWYLFHDGYAVETANHFLIFDYFEPEKEVKGKGLKDGVINYAELKGKRVRVFVTHSHPDHWDKRIFDLEGKLKDVKYFFGWKEEAIKNYNTLPFPRATYKDSEMEVYTINSHHSGVPESAFLVKIDGLTIFHGGDYRGIMAENEKSNAPEDVAYLNKAAKLDGNGIDLMFLNSWVGKSNTILMNGLKPKVIFPMHDGHKAKEEHLKFAEELKDAGINYPVACSENRGDSYQFKGNSFSRF